MNWLVLGAEDIKLKAIMDSSLDSLIQLTYTFNKNIMLINCLTFVNILILQSIKSLGGSWKWPNGAADSRR